jgi:hypothetical protein
MKSEMPRGKKVGLSALLAATMLTGCTDEDTARRALDAARYRFLRSREAMLQDDLWEQIGDKEDESFDSAVDTAMARTPIAGVQW